ncbi:hypothetical protein XM38_012160 [Halomicronema hongdechloris C2206]|uniref:Uncharacterized protein n=1 Tax=Halomicronema hongdechloris C2206 TaxID=1641165 RepID=A0A1Z3HIY4_9CYAN|nr:hypothetical protein [Halomicronema hongdechloris]ASC70279.1 hypothetical protein XM38_012160 [Halomicronema hongdechloris C2206]
MQSGQAMRDAIASLDLSDSQKTAIWSILADTRTSVAAVLTDEQQQLRSRPAG